MNTTGDHAFDARMRQHHAQALANMSARTLAQLQVRLHAAAAPPQRGSLRAIAWPLAAACAAGVLAVGLQWRQSDPAPIPGTPSVTAVSEDEFVSVYGAFDEAPDLYLWLASNDAATLAME